MTDIVERARQRNFPYGHLELVDKMADEIVRLRTNEDAAIKFGAAMDEENDKLRAEIEQLQTCKRAQAEDIMTLGQEVGRLEIEIARLRAIIDAAFNYKP